MEEDLQALIQLNKYPVVNVLDKLLKDKTTKKNIIFATNEYDMDVKSEITKDFLLNNKKYKIQPRVSKSLEEQSNRTRTKAEVFTPSWICNKMNNHCDDEWFGRTEVFNVETEQGWITKTDNIIFNDKSWKDYVESKRLEITCGEAPYIVSRYDAATGEIIEIKDRIGILDRKLRVINENTTTENEWLKWVYIAFQSVYGYEFQGDNLLIARINLLNTFVEYMQDRWDRTPTNAEINKVVNIICWNLWQMDGINGTIPYGKPMEEYKQITFFDYLLIDEQGEDQNVSEDIECRIYDWKANKSIAYRSIKEGK